MIKKTEDSIIITIPRFAERHNPYDEDYKEKMDNVIGLWESEHENGIAGRIDMGYKDKGDQFSDYIYKLNGSKEEFEKMCKELEIDTVYLEKCAYCKKTLYGAHTIGDLGLMCFGCEIDEKKK